MGTPFRLELKTDAYETAVESGEFSAGETQVLRQYLDEFERLAQSRALNAGIPCRIRLEWDEDSARIETDLPDDDTVSVLLHRLRPFILSREPASFDAVCSIVGKHVSLAAVRRLLREWRREYSGRRFQESMAISINDVVINSERVMQDWLNSHEYHRDSGKRDDISKLLAAFPNDFARGVFISMLIDKSRAVARLAQLVSLLMGNTKRLGFNGFEEDFGAGSSA